MGILSVIFLLLLAGKVFQWGYAAYLSWWVVFLPLVVEIVVDILIAIFWGTAIWAFWKEH